MKKRRQDHESESEDTTGAEEMDDFELVEEHDEKHREHADPVKKLREKLKKCEGERQEYLDGWQRAQADIINIRRAETARTDEVRAKSKEAVLLDIVSVLDSFDMAFGNTAQWESVSENWRKGIEYIYTQLLSVLAEHGLNQFDPQGEAFDPYRHESIATVTVQNKADDGVVVETMQKGYMLADKVIRPAKVKVGHYDI